MGIVRKLFLKYKLIFLDEETYEERFSVRLNRINILIIISLFTLLVIGSTVLILKFTPIKNYFIPSAQEQITEDKRQIIDLLKRVHELEEEAEANDLYINNINSILSGKTPEIQTNSNQKETNSNVIDYSELKLEPSEQDLALREEVAKEEIFSISNKTVKNNNEPEMELLFTPLKGIITSEFNAEENHYAIDVAAQKGEAVKAVAAGTVIVSSWTPETGYVIALQHTNNMVSIYKHNLTVYKRLGDLVKKGEVISSVGNTGEFTTGPHLHFELWIDGKPVNPQNYIIF